MNLINCTFLFLFYSRTLLVILIYLLYPLLLLLLFNLFMNLQFSSPLCRTIYPSPRAPLSPYFRGEPPSVSLQQRSRFRSFRNSPSICPRILTIKHNQHSQLQSFSQQ